METTGTSVRGLNGSTHRKIKELGPWFHNIHLRDGEQTAPGHFLGDFPETMWRVFRDRLPKDLSGWTTLDIGCNAGFYSFEPARRGARVTGIDSEPLYLRQAEWLAEEYFSANRPTFHRMRVHDLARIQDERRPSAPSQA